RSTVKLVGMTLERDGLRWVLFGVSAAVTAAMEKEMLWLVVASGLVAMFVKAPPRLGSPKSLAVVPPFLLMGIHGPAELGTLERIAWFFTKAGAFVFGSGLAIVPFLYQGVVKDYGWLNEQQFRDAVAVAMVTPGPVVITVAFIGFLVAGTAGAVAAALGIFAPVYVLTIVPAPWFKR